MKGGSWASIAAGAIGLAVLDAVVSRQKAAQNVGGLLEGAGRAVEWFLSPAVPAFRTSSSPSSSSTASTAAYAGPAAGSTPPSSSASSQPTGSNPTPTGGGVVVNSPTGPILEFAT